MARRAACWEDGDVATSGSQLQRLGSAASPCDNRRIHASPGCKISPTNRRLQEADCLRHRNCSTPCRRRLRHRFRPPPPAQQADTAGNALRPSSATPPCSPLRCCRAASSTAAAPVHDRRGAAGCRLALTALGLTMSLITTSLPASASGNCTSATRPMVTCLANGILALPTVSAACGRRAGGEEQPDGGSTLQQVTSTPEPAHRHPEPASPTHPPSTEKRARQGGGRLMGTALRVAGRSPVHFELSCPPAALQMEVWHLDGLHS